jgi:hypothetical protein
MNSYTGMFNANTVKQIVWTTRNMDENKLCPNGKQPRDYTNYIEP